MINEEMQSMFRDFNPVNEPTIEVKIEFKPGKMVEDLANALMYELVRVAGPTGEFMLRDLDVESIRKYLCTLSWMRRTRAAGLSNKTTVLYRSLSRNAACPVLWYQVLVGIGVATDRDYSIRFVPGTSISESDLLAPEEMQTISDIMFRLQNNGFKVVAGVPQNEEGELDFMAMSHVEELVLSYRKSHPVYGFMASFFATKEVSNALGALVRIRYGYDSDYKVLLTKVVASVGGEGA
jgi:hypothetical protein